MDYENPLNDGSIFADKTQIQTLCLSAEILEKHELVKMVTDLKIMLEIKRQENFELRKALDRAITLDRLRNQRSWQR